MEKLHYSEFNKFVGLTYLGISDVEDHWFSLDKYNPIYAVWCKIKIDDYIIEIEVNQV